MHSRRFCALCSHSISGFLCMYLPVSMPCARLFGRDVWSACFMSVRLLPGKKEEDSCTILHLIFKSPQFWVWSCKVYFFYCFNSYRICIRLNPSATKTRYVSLVWHVYFSLLCPIGRLLNADDVLKPRDMTRNHVYSTEFSGRFHVGDHLYR
jgi:hypothetical protein